MVNLQRSQNPTHNGLCAVELKMQCKCVCLWVSVCIRVNFALRVQRANAFAISPRIPQQQCKRVFFSKIHCHFATVNAVYTVAAAASSDKNLYGIHEEKLQLNFLWLWNILPLFSGGLFCIKIFTNGIRLFDMFFSVTIWTSISCRICFALLFLWFLFNGKKIEMKWELSLWKMKGKEKYVRNAARKSRNTFASQSLVNRFFDTMRNSLEIDICS